MEITYTLDGRPQTWKRASGTRRRFTPKEVRQAKQAHRRVSGPLLEQVAWDPDGVFELVAMFFFEPPKKAAPSKGWPRDRLDAARRGEVFMQSVPDLDNLTKLVKDALNPDERSGFRGAWVDDARVVKIRASKFYREVPSSVITVRRL